MVMTHVLKRMSVPLLCLEVRKVYPVTTGVQKIEPEPREAGRQVWKWCGYIPPQVFPNKWRINIHDAS